MKSVSHVQLLATPWTTAYQAPPSMGFSRQEYWSGVPLPSPDIFSSSIHFRFFFSFLWETYWNFDVDCTESRNAIGYYGYVNNIISFGMWTWEIFTLICILFRIFSSMLYIFQHTALSPPWPNLVLIILLFPMLLQIRLFFFLIVHCFYIEAQLILYPDILLHSYVNSNTRKSRWPWVWQ